MPAHPYLVGILFKVLHLTIVPGPCSWLRGSESSVELLM